ncbi:hypothetical protein [Shewanella baltica]|uniref:hypothetical protein n=1 Tax=Shewanella baltica TaxID=62322 RepID=UPI003218BC13
MNRPDTENNSEINGEINCKIDCKIDYGTQGKLTTYVRYSGSVLPACLAAYFAFLWPLPSSSAHAKKQAQTRLE